MITWLCTKSSRINRVVFLTAVTINGTIAPLVFLKDLSTWLIVNHNHELILWTGDKSEVGFVSRMLGL
jgi:hypothetical protein